MRTIQLFFCLGVLVSPVLADDSAADLSTRSLLDSLEERQMHDVMLAVLDRVVAEKDASAELKKEVSFRRAAALVGISRTEADSKKRAGYLDEAQQSLDTFLKSGEITDRQAIAAYTQKGNLLVERGRSKADQANRPGADAKTLRAEAAQQFDEAIKSLKGTVKPNEKITTVTNAEDAVLKVLREVTGKIQAIKDTVKKADDKDDKAGNDDKPKPGKPAPAPKLTVQQQREIESLIEDQEALQGKLVQTRLTVAAAVFEKARSYPEKSKEWTDVITQSATLFKEIADKYPSKGGGLFARYYEGRNYALLGKWDLAVGTLAPLVVLDQKVPLAIMLRSRALNTTLEALTGEVGEIAALPPDQLAAVYKKNYPEGKASDPKDQLRELATPKYKKFDDSARRFALEEVNRLPGARLDAEWLGLKYRAAVILDTRADALDPKDAKTRSDRTRLQADAKKLATEVAKANADFAAEARELAAKLGKVVAEGEKTFSLAMDEAKVSLATMQERLAEFRAAGSDATKSGPAKAAAGTARNDSIAKLEEAMKLAGLANPLAADPSGDSELKDASIDDINQARYLLTYLLYDGQRYEESAGLGQMLVERYPNAKGSRQAAKIAMASWQQAAQLAEGKERDDARAKAVKLAGTVMQVWPDEAESADAAVIAIGAAVSARDAAGIITIIGQVPPASPKRAEILLRAGSALWREVQEARRIDEATRPDEKTIAGWAAAAREALDEGLANPAFASSLPEGPPGTLGMAGALSRVQLAMDDDDAAKALALLEQPVYGPWTLIAAKHPLLQQGPLAEAALTLSLRLFIQAEKFEQAQQAMDGLERVAGTGQEASAKLTAMYLSMGRDLQTQLEQLGAGGKATDPAVRAKAERILGGFEKFLDRVASRDQKISSQFWVATTYLTLGSKRGNADVVPAAKKAAYLAKAADVYESLLGKTADPEVARFEPSIRLRMVSIYRELGKWAEAQQQIDWILADPKRQNSLETQIQAAELLQAAADAKAKEDDAETANTLYREAAGGRRGEPVVIWGWGNIANRLARQGFTGTDEKSRQASEAFFNARLRIVECLVARARLPGKQADKKTRLEAAETAIAITRKLYPDLGGPAMATKFEALLKQVQQDRGDSAVKGFAAFDEKPAAAGGDN